MATSSTLLVREAYTDLTPFGPRDLALARSQWLQILHDRMAALEVARRDTVGDFEYGGAAGVCCSLEDLEMAVDEARRMVCLLSGEMRRRSEGQLPLWQESKQEAGMARAQSAVMGL